MQVHEWIRKLFFVLVSGREIRRAPGTSANKLRLWRVTDAALRLFLELCVDVQLRWTASKTLRR